MRSFACTAAFALLVGFAAVAPRARAAGADGEWSSRRSSHFELFQDVAIERHSGRDGSRAFERDLLEVLESVHDRLRDAIGVEPRGRVRVFVYDPVVFDASHSARFGFRAAGFWDGAIHVRGGWLPLAALGGASFAGLDEPTARLAYLESYACVERILREYGRAGSSA